MFGNGGLRNLLFVDPFDYLLKGEFQEEDRRAFRVCQSYALAGLGREKMHSNWITV